MDLDFGSIPLGDAQEFAFTIANLVDDPQSMIEILEVEVSGTGFSLPRIPQLPITIRGGGRVQVAVRFHVESVGQMVGGVRVVARRGINSPAIVRLSGRGVLPDGGPSTIDASWDFDADMLSFSEKDGFEVAEIRGLWTPLEDETRLGLPSLPVLSVQLLLPRDRRIAGVTLRAVPQTIRGEHVLYPVQHLRLLDGSPPPPFVPPDASAYSSPAPYRREPVEVVHETWFRGYRIATVNLYPLQFVGATSTATLSTHIDATFRLEPMTDSELARMAPKLRPDARPSFREGVRRRMTERMLNPDALPRFYGELPQPRGTQAYGGFTPSEMPSLDSPPVEYVIVTSAPLVAEFQVLADWKTRSGIPAVIRTVDWIDARYPGLDSQERIRNFIRDAYAQWGTNYMLLGGDTEVVPDRFFYVPPSSPGDPNFQDPPVDYYFAALDGNWNTDQDSRFGEALDDEPSDLEHEVLVARAPVNTPEEAATFVDKILTHSRVPGSAEIDGSHYNSLLLLGGSTNGLETDDSNGIWVAESIEDAIGSKVAEIMAPHPAVKRLYENVFFDEDGPCESTDGDYCQSDPWGFREFRCFSLGGGKVRVRLRICTDADAADRFELSVDQGSGFTFTWAQGIQGQWTLETYPPDPHRIVWVREQGSGPQSPNTCEGAETSPPGPSYQFEMQGCPDFSCGNDCLPEAPLELTERLYLGSQLVYEGTETTVSECGSYIIADLREFLCEKADSTAIFEESRANRFNEAGVLQELGSGYGYVFHQEHSYTDRLGGPSNANHGGPCCVDLHHPAPPLPTTRGVVSSIDSGNEYGVFFSIGSYQNSIDKDAVSEALMRIPSGGAVAYLAQQRSTQSPLRWLVARDFFVNCYDSNRFADLGSAAFDAMETGEPGDGRPDRQTTVELLLLGDPAMPIFSDAPQALALSGSGLNPITSLGERTLEFSVTRGGVPAPGSLVCVSQDSAGGAVGELLYKFAEADSNGVVAMDVSIETDAALQITATARNARPDTASVPVSTDPADSVAVFYTDQQLLGGLDDGLGRARAGYAGSLRVTVENRGGAMADDVSGILGVRGTVTFNLSIDVDPNNPPELSALPEYVFIGPARRHPPTQPFTFQQLAMAGIDPNGAPNIQQSDRGCFVWRETTDRKWYIACKGLGGEIFVGDVRSSGGFKYVDDSGFDQGDTLRCDGGSCQGAEPLVVTFRTSADGSDEDTVSFEAGDFKNLLLTDWNEDFGDIPPDSSATADFDLEVLPAAEDGHEALMELEVVQEGHPVRFSFFTLQLTASELTVVRQAPFFIPPDTVRLAIRVRNRGTADAENVTVRIENEQYATIIDGTRNLGRIRAGRESEAQNLKARFDVPHVADVRLRVTLENRYSGGGGETISWTQSGVDIIPPLRATALQAVPGPGGALITWLAPDRVPPVQPDSAIAGFNIYRREEGSNDRPRVNDSLVVASTFYDDFSFDSFGGDMGLVEEWPYWYEVATVDSSWNETLSNATSTTLWLAELPGWPKQIDVGTEGSVLVEDIDADGDLEIMHAGRSVFAWHHDGTEVVDGDHNAATGGVFVGDSTFAALGDTLSLESGRRFMNDIAAWPGHLVVGSSWGGKAYFWTPTGELVDTAPGGCNPCNLQGGAGFASPVIADMNLDGKMEIVVSTHTGWVNRWIYDAVADTIGGMDARRLYAGSSNFGGPAIGNVDGDTQLEIVYPTRDPDHSVIAVNYDWTHAWEYPLGVSPRVPSTPVITNLDSDIVQEVILSFAHKDVATGGIVAAIDGGVALNTHWPVAVGHQIGDGDRVPSPAVADIRGDAAPEVIIGDGVGGATVNVSVIDSTGTRMSWHLEYLRNYEVNVQGVRSPISVVNIDSDPKAEVIHGTDLHHVVVWDSAGSPEAGWPIVVRESVRGRVTIANLDNLGKLEVVASDLAGLIHVWDYRDQVGIGIPTLPSTASRDYLGLNRPNPFNPSTVIPFAVSRQGRVHLRIYSVSGRLLRELESAIREPGSYETAWDGRDQHGRVLPSGVYLSELSIDEKRVGTRKLLLLR